MKSSKILQRIKRFVQAEDGPTSVEYAVLLALMVGMMISAIIYVGSEGNAVSENVVNGLDDALNK